MITLKLTIKGENIKDIREALDKISDEKDVFHSRSSSEAFFGRPLGLPYSYYLSVEGVKSDD